MDKKRENILSARNIAFFSVLLALVIVLQVYGGYIKIAETSLAFVLVPIVLGGILIGVWAGALLGFAFGLIVLIFGVTGADLFTNTLFNAQPFMTVLICIGKGVAAGAIPALLYKVLYKLPLYLRILIASIAAPVVNTGLFIIGALCMFGTMCELFGLDGGGLIYFLFITCAGINFIIELAINIACAPALFTVTRVIDKKVFKNYNIKKTDEVE